MHLMSARRGRRGWGSRWRNRGHRAAGPSGNHIAKRQLRLPANGKSVKVDMVALDVITGGHVLDAAGDRRMKAESAGLIEEGKPAAGTRGRDMLQGTGQIRIHGQWIPVRAEVDDLSPLSAHADADELMRWLTGFRHAPSHVFIVHGEAEAAEALRVRIGKDLNWNATVPRQDQEFDL